PSRALVRSLVPWRRYTARAGPTLAVIDPEGYLVAMMAGEGHLPGLMRLVDDLVATHRRRGTLRGSELPVEAPPAATTTLRFPGKAVVLPDGGLLVSDSARHSLVELEADATTVRRRIGAGERGRTDGGAGTARFNEPQGLCRLPEEVARRVGYDVVVADTVNHLLRGVRLGSGPDGVEVRTVAGTGRPWRGTVDFEPHEATAV